jgi:glycerophosphoryl diester phosphodiesterase
VEVDVRLTADDRLVLLHDRDLRRLLGRRGWADRYTLDELRATPLLTSSTTASEERVLTLEDALQIVPGGIVLELKTDGSHPDRVADVALRILSGISGSGDRVLVQSFDPRALRRFADRAPGFVRVQLVGARRRRTPRWRAALSGIGYPHGFGLDLRVVTRRLARILRRDGFGLLVWTARSREDLAQARRVGADLVMVDPVPDSARTAREVGEGR